MSTAYGPYTPVVGAAFSQDIGTATSCQGFSVLNESAFLLQVTIGSQQQPVPAWTNYYIDVTHLNNFNGGVSLLPVSISSSNNPPSNVVYLTSYGPNELVNMQQFGALSRQTNVGNPVSTVAAIATSIANDGNASIVPVVEARILGSGGSNVLISNDGTYSHTVPAYGISASETLTAGDASHNALLLLAFMLLEIRNPQTNILLQLDVSDGGFSSINWKATARPRITWSRNAATNLAMDIHIESDNGFIAKPLLTVDESGNAIVAGSLKIGTSTQAINAMVSFFGLFNAGAGNTQQFTHNLGVTPTSVIITATNTSAIFNWETTGSDATHFTVRCSAGSSYFSAILVA